MEETTPSHGTNWTALQKNAFRFFFLFLGATSFTAFNVLVTIFNIPWEDQTKFMSVFSRPIAWLDHHFYHFGFDPKKHLIFLGDGPFGWAFLLTLFFVCIIGAMIWALLDRQRKNYKRLHYWFRTYLAYYLFLTMVIYAVEKIIPVQMPYPNVEDLLTPVGDLNGFSLVWDFIGSNKGYSIFTGTCELVASILILFRRTRVFGSLFLTAVLVNVVCLNVFYNIMVKLLCMQLLLTTLFLLAPYIPRLVRFFYDLKPVSLEERTYTFSTAWKKWVIILLCIAPIWVTYGITRRSIIRYRHIALTLKNQKLYNTEIFLRGTDTLPPLQTDTLRWKRFVMTPYRDHKVAVIYSMNDEKDFYEYDIDSNRNTITLHDNPDTTTWHIFKYGYPKQGKYQLMGKWKGQPVSMIMNDVAIDSLFLLNKEKMTWVHNF